MIPLARTAAIAGVVVLATTAATVVAARSDDRTPPATTVEPVSTTRVVCPDPVGSPQINSTVSAFVVPGLPGQGSGAGKAVITVSGKAPKGKAATKATIDAPGGSATLTTAGYPLPPIVGTATGSLAPGFVVDQLSFADYGVNRGLAALACASPGTDAWFAGGGSRAGRTTVVVLANPEANPAQADVVLYGPKGPVAAPGGRGVVVPARSQVRLTLTNLAPAVDTFVIHVAVRSGRVSAAVEDREIDGLDAQGTDWVPQAQAPATRIVVPGVPARVPSAVLTFTSPDADATVKLRVLSGDGAFAPAGHETIDVNAGAVASVDLTEALAGSPAAIELTSDQPVVAGLRYWTKTKAGALEFGYAAAAPPLAGVAAIAGLPGGDDADGRVILTALKAPAKVELRLRSSTGGRTATRTVEVPADSTVVVDLAPPVKGEAFNVVVVPPFAGGQVYAARLSVRRGVSAIGASGYPLTAVRSVVVVPEADADLGAALPAAP